MGGSLKNPFSFKNFGWKTNILKCDTDTTNISRAGKRNFIRKKRKKYQLFSFSQVVTKCSSKYSIIWSCFVKGKKEKKNSIIWKKIHVKFRGARQIFRNWLESFNQARLQWILEWILFRSLSENLRSLKTFHTQVKDQNHEEGWFVFIWLDRRRTS